MSEQHTIFVDDAVISAETWDMAARLEYLAVKHLPYRVSLDPKSELGGALDGEQVLQVMAHLLMKMDDKIVDLEARLDGNQA